MTAKGNEEFVTKARDTIEAAVIGLIIVAAAYAITNFIFAKLAEAPPAAPVALPPPSGCALTRTAADCQPPACRWNRLASTCVDVQPPEGSTADCSQFTQQLECNAGGCIWLDGSCLATVSDPFGICLRVIGSQLYCGLSTKSGCDRQGAVYSFYEGKEEPDCADQQSTYLPLEAITPCADKGGQCIENVADCNGRSSGNGNDCTGDKVCCLP